VKFERLGIERFGQFESLDLDLAGADLVLIHGPNEAGKSTLLRAIHGLLFGIDERSPDNFRFPYPAMHLTATLRDGAGQRIELSRRKKRKDALLGTLRTDLGELALDEPRFARYFGAITEDLYRQIFGFHHDDLQRGAEILNIAGLGELLGGGALGGSAESLRRVLGDLHDEADDLYKERGKNPPINRSLTQLHDLRASLRDATLQQPQYLALTSNLKISRETLLEADSELTRLRQRAARIDTLLLAFEDFHEHQRLERRLADPDLACSLAHADALRVAPLLAEHHALEHRHHSLTEEILRLERRAAHHPVDHALLAEASTLERLLRRVETVAAHRHDLPRTHARLTRERADLLAQLTRLSPGTPDLSPGTSPRHPPTTRSTAQTSDLSPTHTPDLSFRPAFAPVPPAELEHIRLALARWQRTRQELSILARAHADDAAELAALTTTADAISAQLPDEHGRELLAQLEHLHDTHADLGRLDLELTRQSADLALALARLHPRPAGDPSLLPLPAPAAVQDLQARRHELDADRREAHNHLSEQTAELARLDAELAALAGHDLPDPARLGAARTHRDDTWSLVRQQLLAPRPGPQRDLFSAAKPEPTTTTIKPKPADAKQLARAYERAVTEADLLADRLRDAAEHLAQRTALGHAAARVRQTLAATRERLAAHDAADRQWQAAWLDLWRPLAISPTTPTAMLAWLADAAALRDLATIHARRTREAAALRPAIDSFEARLRRHLDAPDAAWPHLVHQLRARERAAEHLRGRLDSTLAQISSLRAALARTAATRDLLTRDLDAATSDLRHRTTALGLPPDLDPESALRHLDALSDLADRLAAVDRQLATTDQSLAALADFDAEVTALRARLQPVPSDTLADARTQPVPSDTSLANTANTLAATTALRLQPVPSDTPPEHTVELLGRALADARAAATTQALARDESADRHREQTRLAAALAALAGECAALRVRAGADDDAALADMAECALHRHTLTRTRDDLELRLARILGDGAPRTAYAAELQAARRESLQSERQSLAHQISDLDARRLAAVEQRGRLEHEAQQLGGDRAARLSSELEVSRADLEDNADRYILLHLAERVLSRVADRYARDNQPAILQYTSDLLTRITGGRHVRAVVQPEARTLALLGRDGQLRQPGDLSSGTREQLFLALRLAYVLDYCDRCESLPVVMDDVLVNFDDARAAAALAALRDLGKSTQVVLLTCHRRWLDLAASAAPDARILELPPEPSPILTLHGPGRAAEA
jgi:uncharacterized protein YhaN